MAGGGGRRSGGSAVGGEAEAGVRGRRVGAAPLPGGDPVAPAVRLVAQERAALRHPGVVRADPAVGAPLPDVAGHVVQAVAVGGYASTGRCRSSRRRRSWLGERRPATRSSGARRRARARRPTGRPRRRGRRGRRTPTRPRSAAARRPRRRTRRRRASDTCTTGWSARSPRSDCGPSGCAQSAPSTWRHHGAAATPRVGGSRRAAGRRRRTTSRSARHRDVAGDPGEAANSRVRHRAGADREAAERRRGAPGPRRPRGRRAGRRCPSGRRRRGAGPCQPAGRRHGRRERVPLSDVARAGRGRRAAGAHQSAARVVTRRRTSTSSGSSGARSRRTRRILPETCCAPAGSRR